MHTAACASKGDLEMLCAENKAPRATEAATNTQKHLKTQTPFTFSGASCIDIILEADGMLSPRGLMSWGLLAPPDPAQSIWRRLQMDHLLGHRPAWMLMCPQTISPEDGDVVMWP